jgi:hypothetical protein
LFRTPFFLSVLVCFSFFASLPARADTIQEFVMPIGGSVSIQFLTGEAGGVTTFGLGTSPSDFIALLTGLPNSPSSLQPINIGSFAAGAIIHMGMFTTFGGASGWAFSSGTDQASIIAFSDTTNSLGLGGSIIQRTGRFTYVLHLDDALSYTVDDDNNDVLIKVSITPNSVTTPEPTTIVLFLSGSALVGWKARRRRQRDAADPREST